MASSQSLDNDVFRVLIATDLHLGYAEKDPLRGNDTFNTFEEVLQIAVDRDVDFVLLGGDLFHENRPSSKTMTRCIELLRKYCTGDKTVKFQVVSDQSENFKHTELFPFVNYEDQNINISVPVFSIHGNHDDPIGKDHLCALETISAAGLINYFGKSENMEEIVLSPVLLTKGNNQIALYGLGFLPEERLHRIFLNKKVTYLCPEKTDDWLKIFVVHQNRVKHGTKYLPENFLTTLPDLVVWGHEHESFDYMQWNSIQQFHIYQPGSTVITSLCPGEAKPKHVGLLTYNGGTKEPYVVTPIPLVTPRKLYFETFNADEAFSEMGVAADEEALYKFCTNKVESILHRAEVEHSGDEREPKEPLIRLRVEYSNEYHVFSTFQFGQQFADRVANPKEILLFKALRNRKHKIETHTDFDTLDELMEVDQTMRYNIEDVIKEYFGKVDRKGQMNLLCENKLTSSVKLLVEKDASVDLISNVIEKRVTETIAALESDENINVEDKHSVLKACFEYKESRKQEEANDDLKDLLKNKPRAVNDSDDDIIEESDEETWTTPATSRGRGKRPNRRGSVRGSRSKKATGLKPLF